MAYINGQEVLFNSIVNITEGTVSPENDENLAKSREVIVYKGGTVGEVPSYENLPSEIESIPSGDANYVFVDDTDTAYKKQILAGAAPLAKLKSIGGMTHKRVRLGENLISPPKTVSETHTGGGYVYLYPSLIDAETDAVTLEAGEYIIKLNLTANAPMRNNFIGMVYINGDMVSGSMDGTGGYKFTLTETTAVGHLTCDYEFQTDAESITVTYSPTLMKSEYELVDTKVKAIRSHGANLAKMVNGSYDLNIYYSATFNNGHLRLDRKSYTSARECSATTFHPYTQVYLGAGTYTIKCNNITKDKISTLGMYVVKSNGDAIVNGKGIDGSNTFTLESPDTIKWGIYAYEKNDYADDGYLECDVMLNLGTTALPYSPYREPITYEIPEALQGSGKGVAGYNDTVDFERGKNIERCKTIIFDGVSTDKKIIFVDTTAGVWFARMALSKPSASATSLINTHFNTSNVAAIGNSYIAGGNGYLIMINADQTLTTVDAWNAWLQEQYASGNPVTVTYAVAEPIETDLAETISTYLEVEAGGYLEFVNDDSKAVPSNISYIRRIV